MTRNTLTQEYVRALFDYRDGKLFWKSPRPKVRVGAEAGTAMPDGRRAIRIDRVRYLTHRIIFLFHHAVMPMEIDHRNRNPTDNRIENLRAVTHRENHFNRRAQGVDYMKSKRQWRARIRDMNGRDVHLGLFRTRAEAVAAYANAKPKLHFINGEGVEA